MADAEPEQEIEDDILDADQYLTARESDKRKEVNVFRPKQLPKEFEKEHKQALRDFHKPITAKHKCTHIPAMPRHCEVFRVALTKNLKRFRGSFRRDVKKYGEILTMDHVRYRDWFKNKGLRGKTTILNTLDIATRFRTADPVNRSQDWKRIVSSTTFEDHITYRSSTPMNFHPSSKRAINSKYHMNAARQVYHSPMPSSSDSIKTKSAVPEHPCYRQDFLTVSGRTQHPVMLCTGTSARMKPMTCTTSSRKLILQCRIQSRHLMLIHKMRSKRMKWQHLLS